MPGGVELDGGEYERLAGHADEGREEDRGLGGGELEGEVQDRRGISRNQNVSDDLEEGHEGMDERELGRGAGRENREVVDGGTAVHGHNETMDNGERAGGALAAGNEGSEGSGEVLVTLTSRSRDLLDMMCSSAMRGFIARKDRAMARAGILDALLRDAEAEAGKLPVSSKNHAEDHQLVRIKIGSKGRGGKHDGKNLVNRLARLHKKVPLGNR